MHLTGEATQWMIPGIYYHLRSVRSELLVSRLTGWVSVLSTQTNDKNFHLVKSKPFKLAIHPTPVLGVLWLHGFALPSALLTTIINSMQF